MLIAKLGAKEIRCPQAETRQQEASIRQRSLQPFRCTGTQFRICRWELDSLQRHRSLFSNGFLGPVSRKHQDWFAENDKEIQGLLEEKHQKHKAYPRNTSSVSSKTAYSNISKTVQTRLRDMQDSWLKKKADEIQSFADRKDMMKKFFDALKTVYGPQSPETIPLLSAELVFWLTKKLSWRDGLNTLMVSLIGHHLSMIKLSTDYHRWNVIRAWWASNRLWNNESNDTSVIWQRSRIRCNTCRDLQSRRFSSCRETDRVISHYVEKRSHPSRIQGCNNYPPIQKERKSSSLWQSSRHLFIVNCWEDSC